MTTPAQPTIEFVIQECRDGFVLAADDIEMICDSEAEATDAAVTIAQEVGALYTIYWR